jgi:AraC-like DNA-binding protein
MLHLKNNHGMIRQNIFESNLKKIGLLIMNSEGISAINSGAYKLYIKVLYAPEGYRIKVDFSIYTTTEPTLFFVAPNQFLGIEASGIESGWFMFYNRDFYCIQIHDEEVACDGLLFNNIHNMPRTSVPKEHIGRFNDLFLRMEEELVQNESCMEEMIRTYLKQLLIRATRIWKKEHLDTELVQQSNDLEFFRKFTLLVDQHYHEKHTVSDYADMLFMAPKTITHKFSRLKLPQPNEIIKNRIVLEAKRLLVHTSMSAKEIAYELGYEDPAYFSRLFLVKTGESPSRFRAKYYDAV